jgi:oxygen-independent coproporphyrinogen-3 oxidase
MGTTIPYENTQSFGVYLHFPFCVSRCTYCDFVVTTKPDIPHLEYADALIAELEERAQHFDGLELVSIYLGGGTPSLWEPREIGRVITRIKERFGSESLAEVTMEANPGDQFQRRLDAYVEAGVTRMSMGVQSFNDERLKNLSRRHSGDDARASIRATLDHPGIQSMSADLIYGLSGSTTESALSDLNELLNFGVPHLSLYALMLEPETSMAHQVRRGLVELPDDDLVADQGEALLERIEASPLELYEISNAGKRGHWAIHNSLYWHMRPYLGLGMGAHGLEPVEGSPGLRRRTNQRRLQGYLDAPLRAEKLEDLSPDIWLKDSLLVRPRWLDGFDPRVFDALATKAQGIAIAAAIDSLMSDGLLIQKGLNVALSRRGQMLSNSVSLRLFEAVEDVTS